MTSRRQKLLEATAHLAERSGVTSITLEAVAERAGVSKGGLLHHFPSKAALVKGMVEWTVSRYYDLVAKEVSGAPSGENGIARAYVTTSSGAGADTQLWNAVLTATLLQPSLLDIMRERARPLFSAAVEGPEDVDAAVAWLAADGLWLAEMLGLYDLDPELRAAVVERLHELSAERPAPRGRSTGR